MTTDGDDATELKDRAIIEFKCSSVPIIVHRFPIVFHPHLINRVTTTALSDCLVGCLLAGWCSTYKLLIIDLQSDCVYWCIEFGWPPKHREHDERPGSVTICNRKRIQGFA